MQGGQGNDWIYAGDNADTLLGGAGHDSLYGEKGNDLLDGGSGNDSLWGGDGADTYVFGIGAGHDTVYATDGWYGQTPIAPVDTVRLGAGIAPADFMLARVGDDLVLSLPGGNDSLTVQGYYYGNANYEGNSRIQLQFADGTIWGASEITARLIHVDGTLGNDWLYGTAATDSMQGGQANDQIWAAGNADTLRGGEGHDSLFGEQGNDLLDGGSGNDSLMGGDGTDTYVFGIGSGHDTVDASDGWSGQQGVAPNDIVRLDASLVPADFTQTQIGDDLVLSLSGGADSLTVRGYYSYNAAYSGQSRIQFQYAPTASNRSVTFNEDTVKTFAVADFGFSDVDAGDSLQSVTVTTLETLGALKLNGVDVTLNQVISAADITAGKLTYTPVANGNGTGYASFGFTVSDGSLSSTSAYTMTLNVAPINDAPTASNRAVTFNEDTVKTFALADFGFSDVDAGDSLQSVSVTTLETLGALKLNGVDVTLNQVISAADITAGKLTYTPVANGNGTGYASFGFKVSDGSLSSTSAYTMTLNVAPINDAPTASNRAVTFNEDTVKTFALADFGFSDVDAGDSLQSVSVTTLETLGALKLNGVDVTLNQVISAADITAGKLTYTPVANGNGTGYASFGFTVSDGSLSSTSAYTMTLNVAPINDAPTASNRAVTFNEDTVKTFALADFGFSDVDAGDSLQSVTVTTLETLGALKLNGVDVTLNQVISAADITAGKLTYTPVANGNGTGYASFGFKVSDGSLSSTSAYTMTLNVTPVNDAPTGSVTISGTAKQGQTLTAANTLADVDGLGTISYQWLADGAAVIGATGSTFTLTQAQVGKAVSVKASYTDGKGTAESVTSAATAGVVKAAPGVAFTDFNGDGKADLRWVKDSGEVSLWLMNGANPTAQGNLLPAAGWSVKDSSRDFNGDGKTDLLLSNANGAAAVWTMNGLTPIAKAEHGPYAGWKLVDAAGDYNGDGKADLRWVKDSGEISLWLMNGTVPSATMNFAAWAGWSVKDGSQDFNGDGKTDLLWTNANGAAAVWTMNGLTPIAKAEHGPYAGWKLVDAAGDYNGDGKADLRWVKDSGEISLWLMNGTVPSATMNFAAWAGWSVKDGSRDFNGDGKTDLLWTNANGAAAVWTMNGLTPLAKAEHGPYAGWKLVDAAGDYNGDGKSDLRWVKDSGEVSLWLMNGTAPSATANFGPYDGWRVKDGSQDLNGDGKTDLLWTNINGAASVWTMDGVMPTASVNHGPFAGWKVDGLQSATTIGNWKFVDSAGDYNGDGKADLLWMNTNGAASIWTMNGLGASAKAELTPGTGWKLVDAAGDYNGDGKADLRWVKDSGEVSLWLMNGTTATAKANFGPYDGWSVKDGSQDFNGDGKAELLWTNTNGAVSVWTMNGLSATSIVNHGPYAGWKLVDAAGDYNGDGKADLRWVKDNGEVSLWLMNGTAPSATRNFALSSGWSVKDGSRDFNGDGKSDLLLTNTNGAASVWTMNGLNATAQANHGPFAGWKLADAAGDYNGDGKADLRWVKDNGEISLWLMNGVNAMATANFDPADGLSVKDGSQDLNGDGKTDLLWTDASGAESAWLMDGVSLVGTVNPGDLPGWALI